MVGTSQRVPVSYASNVPGGADGARVVTEAKRASRQPMAPKAQWVRDRRLLAPPGGYFYVTVR